MAPALISGIHIEGLSSALAMAAVLAVINTIVRPILILVTFPLTVLSLGFFLLVINAVTFMMAGGVVSGMRVESFTSAFFGALLVTIVSWVVNVSIRKSSSGKHTIVVKTKGESGVVELHSEDGKKWE